MTIEEEDAPEYIPPFDDEPNSNGTDNEVGVLLGLTTLSIFIVSVFGAFRDLSGDPEAEAGGTGYAVGYITSTTLLVPLGLVAVLLVIPKFRNPRSCVKIFMWVTLFFLIAKFGVPPASN